MNARDWVKKALLDCKGRPHEAGDILVHYFDQALKAQAEEYEKAASEVVSERDRLQEELAKLQGVNDASV
jgi:histidinol-phosphate/aromatic aminotransferase/cobyric acid decarboxylase-like protein